MCYLAFRLYRLSRKFKRDKLDEVVRQHRRKYGVNDCVNTSVMQQVEKMDVQNDVIYFHYEIYIIRGVDTFFWFKMINILLHLK